MLTNAFWRRQDPISRPDRDVSEQSLQSYAIRFDSKTLAKDIPLDNSKHVERSKANLGNLDRSLPYEIIHEILLHLDLPSLTVFRRVSRQAMYRIDSLPEYSMLYRDCPHILRSLVAVNASFFDLATLYTSLRTERCYACRNTNGTQLYLITGVRICVQCAYDDTDFFGTSYHGVQLATGLSSEAILQVPHMTTIHNRPAPVTSLVFDVGYVKQIRTDVHMTLTLDKPLSKLFVPIPLELPGQDPDWMKSFCEHCRQADRWSSAGRQQYTRKALAEHVSNNHLQEADAVS